MKRKITQIGRLFAAAALLFGATSWANAQEASIKWALGGDGIQAPTEATDGLTGEMKWGSDFAAAGTEEFADADGTGTGVVLTKFTPAEKHSSANAPSVIFTVTPAEGQTFTPKSVSFRTARFGSDSQTELFVYVNGTKINDAAIAPVRSKNADASKAGGAATAESIAPIELSVGDVVIEDGAPVVVEFWFKSDAGKASGLADVVIGGTLAAGPAPTKVAFVMSDGEEDVFSEGRHNHPAYESLAANGKFDIEVLTYASGTSLTADDFVGQYDVVVFESLDAGGSTNLPISVLKNLVGKVPVLFTKSYTYNSGRADWGTGVNGSASSVSIVPEAMYTTHPLFDGVESGAPLVETEGITFNNGRFLQGYTDLTSTAPAHILLAKSSEGLNTVAEAWVDGVPYVLIAYDTDQLKKTQNPNGIELTEAGNALFVNAVKYLVAGEQYEAPYVGKCLTPTVEFVNLALEAGETPGKDSLSIRHTVILSASAVDMDGQPAADVVPTIYYTLDGSAPSAASKKYDAAAPDTVDNTTTVKAYAVFDKYEASPVLDTTWTNPNRLKVATPVISTEWKEGVVYTLSVACETAEADIYFTFDGSDANQNSYKWEGTPFEFTAKEVTLKARAYKEGYDDSDLATLAFKNEHIATLATPVVTVTSGEGFATIEIACASEATEDAPYAIYYTTDGSEPTADSYKWMGKAMKWYGGDATIKAIALGNAWYDSEVSAAAGVVNEKAARSNKIYYTNFKDEPVDWFAYEPALFPNDTDPSTWPKAWAELPGAANASQEEYFWVVDANAVGAPYTFNWKGWTITTAEKARFALRGKNATNSSATFDADYDLPLWAQNSVGLYTFESSTGVTYLQYPEKVQGPFDVELFFGADNKADTYYFSVEVSEDGENWYKVDQIAQNGNKVYHRDTVSYNGGDEVNFRIALKSPASRVNILNMSINELGYSKATLRFASKDAAGAEKLELVPTSAKPVDLTEVPTLYFHYDNQIAIDTDTKVVLYYTRVLDSGTVAVDTSKDPDALQAEVVDGTKLAITLPDLAGIEYNSIRQIRVTDLKSLNGESCDLKGYFCKLNGEISTAVLDIELKSVLGDDAVLYMGDAGFEFAFDLYADDVEDLTEVSGGGAGGTITNEAGEAVVGAYVLKGSPAWIWVTDESGYNDYAVAGTYTITIPEGLWGNALYKESKGMAGRGNKAATFVVTLKEGQSPAGITEVGAAAEVVSTTIYSISGAVQPALVPGVNIVRTVYSDGNVTVEKVIVK